MIKGRGSALFIFVLFTLCGCVASDPSTQYSASSGMATTSVVSDKWTQEIKIGMIEKDLVRKKGKPDVIFDSSDREKVFYYWKDNGHIPVYLKDNAVVQIGTSQ